MVVMVLVAVVVGELVEHLLQIMVLTVQTEEPMEEEVLVEDKEVSLVQMVVVELEDRE